MEGLTEGIDRADHRENGIGRIISSLVSKVNSSSMNELPDPLSKSSELLMSRVVDVGEDEGSLVGRKGNLELGRAFSVERSKEEISSGFSSRGGETETNPLSEATAPPSLVEGSSR